MEPLTSRSVEIQTPDDALVVKISDDEAYCYRNCCPHTQSSLNWQPDAFLSADRDYIICANHGALFQLRDGLCVFGPCAGQSLESVPATIRGRCLYLT